MQLFLFQIAQLINPVLQPEFQGASGSDYFNAILPNIVLLVFIIAAVVFMFMFIINALKWIFSGGNKAQLEDARKGIFSALIGFLILLFAYVVIRVVNYFLSLNIGLVGTPVTNDLNVNPPTEGFAGLTSFNFQTLITSAIQFVLVIAVVIFFFILITGAINWITSKGDRGQVQSARGKVTNAFIGLLIVFAVFVGIKGINTVLDVNIGGLGTTSQLIDINPQGQFQGLGSLSATNLTQRFLSSAVQLVLVTAVIIFFFMFVYGGLKWVTSAGNKMAIESARHTVTNAIIGLVIVFLIFSLLQLINIIFGVNLGNLGVGPAAEPTPIPGAPDCTMVANQVPGNPDIYNLTANVTPGADQVFSVEFYSTSSTDYCDEDAWTLIGITHYSPPYTETFYVLDDPPAYPYTVAGNVTDTAGHWGTGNPGGRCGVADWWLPNCVQVINQPTPILTPSPAPGVGTCQCDLGVPVMNNCAVGEVPCCSGQIACTCYIGSCPPTPTPTPPTSTPVPTNTPTPTPTVPFCDVSGVTCTGDICLNSATGCTCQEVCGNMGRGSCENIGLNAGASDRRVMTYTGEACYTWTVPVGISVCNDVQLINNGVMCTSPYSETHTTNWTYCNCSLGGLGGPTSTPVPTNTPTPTRTPTPTPTRTPTPRPTSTPTPMPTSTPIPTPTPLPVACADSDAGINYFTPGYVYGTGTSCPAFPTRENDACLWNTSIGGNFQEMYCSMPLNCAQQFAWCFAGCNTFTQSCNSGNVGIWIAANVSQSCTSACRTIGRTCSQIPWNDDPNCTILQALTGCVGCYEDDPQYGADWSQPYRIDNGMYANSCVLRPLGVNLAQNCDAVFGGPSIPQHAQRICVCQ